MSDHEFEKQVQEKLGELKLRPSAAVWTRVEENIRRDKRRRFFWLWTPLLFISLSTSAYILYQYAWLPSKHNTTAQSITTASTNNNNNNTEAASTQPVAETATVAALNTTGNNTTATAVNKTHKATPIKENVPPAVAVTTTTTAAAVNEPAAVTTKNVSHNYITVSTDLFVTATRIPKIKRGRSKYGLNRQAGNDNNTLLGNTTLYQSALATPPTEYAIYNDFTASKIDCSLNDLNNNIATEKLITDSLHTKHAHIRLFDSLGAATAILPIQRKRLPVWHWGIETEVGLSRIVQSKFFQLKGLLGGEKSEHADQTASAPMPPTNTVGYLANASTTVVKTASPINADVSYGGGLFVERAISKHVRLSVGLRYQYLSVSTTVGPQIHDSTGVAVNTGTTKSTVVYDYYRTAGSADYSATSALQGNTYGRLNVSSKYRYRFHYLELPVMMHWQVNDARQWPPIVLDGGFSIARMIAADALHYEGVKGIYYKDNTLLNKTQANVIMGVSIGILQHSKHPMWIGADMRYGLSGLVNKNVSGGQYLWSAGVTFKMLLGKL